MTWVKIVPGSPEELDRWAAEVVMDWHSAKTTWYFESWFNKNGTPAPFMVSRSVNSVPVWCPSQDANQCLMLEEKLKGLGYSIFIHWIPMRKRYEVRFVDNGGMVRGEGEDANLKIAILKAAREAWEGGDAL